MNAESEAYLAAYEERYGRRSIPRRVTSEATARRIRFMAEEVTELLALAEPESTPQAVFEQLRTAHAALIQARARLTQDGIYG